MSRNDRWAHDDVLAATRTPDHPVLEVRHGMVLTHTGSNTTGVVAGFAQGDRVILADTSGRKHPFRALDGAFVHNGVRVALRHPTARPRAARRMTASGSVEANDDRARVARASRIWVEGVHDAELIYKIWGYDLKVAGVAVEPLHGADDLAAAVAAFRPGPDRRLGVLLDHLVDGSKERRIADSVNHPAVLVRGHPYVDVWAAVLPATIGIKAWPEVPHGRSWKEGVLAALGIIDQPGRFWATVLDAVTSYRDVATPLVNAVEQLIDFVTVD
ncbi:MAG: DUF3097 domain-containing protein [Acidimicrobiia bacterium]|nr:DUF3097 domain-containing protein [Acidimicrobiia bacterium]